MAAIWCGRRADCHRRSEDPCDIVKGAYTDQASRVTACSGDVSLARELLDWQPHVDLETGIALTVEWYRHREAEWRHVFRESTYRSLRKPVVQPAPSSA